MHGSFTESLSMKRLSRATNESTTSKCSAKSLRRGRSHSESGAPVGPSNFEDGRGDGEGAAEEEESPASVLSTASNRSHARAAGRAPRGLTGGTAGLSLGSKAMARPTKLNSRPGEGGAFGSGGADGAGGGAAAAAGGGNSGMARAKDESELPLEFGFVPLGDRPIKGKGMVATFLVKVR